MMEKLPELERESAIGGAGALLDRIVPQIDMTDFYHRKEEIAGQLWQAATESGFFQLRNHGLDPKLKAEVFNQSRRFFALSQEEKARYPLVAGTNTGWEFMAQVRPSTGIEDRKESFQITLSRMQDLWPGLVGFKAAMLAFERANWALGMNVLSCFAWKLGFDDDFFTAAHDPTVSCYQSTLRLLHYLPMSEAVDPDQIWRAGAHTDFDCLTLLHQEADQGGLQLCPGAERYSEQWTDVPPDEDVVTCNIGDMLMRWSDDQLQSTLHRVKMPPKDRQHISRYSVAFFCQANTDTLIECPDNTYPPITAEEYLRQRVTANAL